MYKEVRQRTSLLFTATQLGSLPAANARRQRGSQTDSPELARIQAARRHLAGAATAVSCQGALCYVAHCILVPP